ncbi:MAG: ketopantoate reductase family protein [Peptococcaceae bacterium]
MSVNAKRILIFGAGVVGSIYALRFFQQGLDVTILARNKRLEELRKNGLQYDVNGTIKSVPVKTIEKLDHDEIYDFIFVPVRFDQIESALVQLQDNRSKTIITLTNTVGYNSWVEIIGDRLLPGFPGAGGDMRDGVLYAQFGSEKHQGTIFGEISGEITERVNELAQILEAAELHYEIQDDIESFHITHAATAIVVKHFYKNNAMLDIQTAKSDSTLSKVAEELKHNIYMLEQAGIPVIPHQTKIMRDWSKKEIMAMYRRMLSNDFTINVLLGEHAIKQQSEISLLGTAFHEKLGCISQKQEDCK